MTYEIEISHTVSCDLNDAITLPSQSTKFEFIQDQA